MIIDKNIGFIGIGNVGEKLAFSILQANYNLFLFDLNKKNAENLISKGAIWKNSIKEIANKVTVIITCLPSPNSIKKVITGKKGLFNYVKKNHLWIEMSTTDEKEMIRLSKLFEKKNVKVLEAPVTGGQHRAQKGNISIFVAGNRANFDRAMPILSQVGYNILYCGKIGNASTLKVVTNYLASTNLLAIGEALMVCKKYGLDLKTAFHAIKISSGNSFVHETESQVILSGTYDVGFTMDLVCKDLTLFDKLTNIYKIPTKISPILLKTFIKGLKKYGDRSFSTSIVKLLEDVCNEDLRSKDFPKTLVDYKKRKKGYEIKF